MDPNKLQTINTINIGGVTFGFAPIDVVARNDFAVIKGLVDNNKLDSGDLLGAQAGYELYSSITELKGTGPNSIAAKISAGVTGAGHLRSVVVTAVPTVATAEANVIYMVEKADAEGEFDRYMLVTDTDNHKYILTLSSTNVEMTAENVEYANENQTGISDVNGALDRLFAKVYYISPAVNTFTASPTGGNFEIGSSVSAPTFSWTLNKDVTSQTLTGCTVTANDRTATYSSAITANKTFTLTVKDAENGTASKSISYNFYPRIYYGSAVLPETVDSAFVLGLTKKDLKSSRAGTYEINVAVGEYGIWASPKSYGAPKCKIGGFDTDLTLLATASITNASGYTQDYYIYRTPNPGLGAISMVIS